MSDLKTLYLQRFQAEDFSTPEWRHILEFVFMKVQPDLEDLKELLFKHPLVDILATKSVFMQVNDYEWLGQNDVWPILLESEPYAKSMIWLNADLLLKETLYSIVKKSSHTFAEQVKEVVSEWMIWMLSRYATNEMDSKEFFQYLMQTFPHLEMSSSVDDFFQVQEDVDNLISCYRFNGEVHKGQAMFRLCFLLEETFLIHHRGHLLSFLETP